MMANYITDTFNSYDQLNGIFKPREEPSYGIQNGGVKHFHTPMTTGTSVLGMKFDNGVVIAADTLGSFGSLARFKECPRISQVNKNIIIGVGGDYADYQYLNEVIKGKIIAEECLEDGIHLKPGALHCWLTKVLYNRRSKIDPLWTSILIGGIEDGLPFLGAVDKLGTAFVDKHIATGYGAYIALPLLREASEKKLKISEDDAVKIITHCLQVLYYRDARSLNKYQIGVISTDKCEIRGPLEIKADWSVAKYVN